MTSDWLVTKGPATVVVSALLTDCSVEETSDEGLEDDRMSDFCEAAVVVVVVVDSGFLVYVTCDTVLPLLLTEADVDTLISSVEDEPFS